MAFECSKSIIRRLRDPNFITKYFIGYGVDIGGAPDPLSNHKELFPLVSDIDIWDLNDGDAQFMNTVEDAHYDFVHSSHCLEHLEDPDEAIINWVRILKPGGHLIVTVPDEDLYEQGVFPSIYNPDHKWTFTIYKDMSWSKKSKNVTTMVSSILGCEIKKIELIDHTHRFAPHTIKIDQTTAISESAIEFVLRKRLVPDELERLGRLVLKSSRLKDVIITR